MDEEQNYYNMSQDPTAGLEHPALQSYQSPAGAELAEGGRDAKLDGIYSNVMAIRSKTEGGAYGGAMPPMYGNEQSGLTNMRASYGNASSAVAYGAMVGSHTVVGGAYDGASRMMADLGGMIRPMSYTPPARVYTGYSGRMMQETGFLSSAKTMVGLGGLPRSTSPYLYQMNAAEDFGERLGLAGGGLGVSLGTIAAGAAGGSIGARFGGVAGSLIGGLAAYQAAASVGEGIYEGVAARQDVQNYLGRTSSQYITSSSKDVDQRRGAGFSREARQDIAEFVRGMDIKDPMMGTGDLATILKGATELGMFAGTSEVADFKKKFKSIVSNLKTVTVTLNQTLEEGLQTMKDLKGVGIDAGQAGEVALRAQSMGRMAGRTASEMVNLGLQGAELYRGTGVQMSIGFQSNLMNLASVRSSRDAGLISQEAIAQAGGEEALAQRMTGGALSFIQSDIGRAAGAAYFQQGKGFNPTAFADMTNRRVDISDMAQAAAQNLSNPAAVIEYQVNQAKNLAELGKSAGGRGFDVSMMGTVIAQAETMSKLTGVSKDMSSRFILQNMGVDQATIDARMAELKDPRKHFEDAQKALQSTVTQQMGDQAANNFFLSRISSQVEDVLKTGYDIAARPINKGAGVLADMAEGIRDQAYGIGRWSTTGTGITAYDEENTYLEGRQRRREEFALGRGKVDLSGSTTGMFFRGVTGASQLSKLGLSDAATLRDAGVEVKDVPISEAGSLGLILDKHYNPFMSEGRRAIGLSGNFKQSLADLATSVSVTPEQAKKMDDDKQLTDLRKNIRFKLTSGDVDVGKLGTFAKVGKAFFGTSKLTPGQQAALIRELGPSGANVSSFNQAYESAKNSAKVGRETLEQIEASELKDVEDAVTQGLTGNYLSLGTLLDVKNDEALALFAQAVDAPTATSKKELLAKGFEAMVKAGEGDVFSSGRAAKLTDKVMKPSEAVATLSSSIGLAQEKSRFIRERKGARLAYDAVSAELAGKTDIDEGVKAEILSVAKEALSPGGVITRAKVSTPEYEANQAVLKQTTMGAEIASNIEKYRSGDILRGMSGSDKDAQREALKGQGVAEASISGILELYSAKGVDRMQEDAIGEANRTLGGTGGVAVVGGGGGSTGATTAADTLAVQTNMNWATYKAMAALADRLGAGR